MIRLLASGSRLWAGPRAYSPEPRALGETLKMPTVDDLMHRYEDLRQRASNLRSYL